MTKIGVFDSGIGGLSVVRALEAAFPTVEIIFENDVQNLPYGEKTSYQLKELAIPHLKSLEMQGCDLIIVACNTLSTTIVPEIRNDFSIPLVPVVPMIKPACALTKGKIIAVCATPTTLASERYAELKAEFGSGIKFIEPYCGDWATMIESNNIDRAKIDAVINAVCEQGADVIVLGCTHYHWIEKEIQELAHGRATVIQPEPAIITHVGELLSLLPHMANSRT